MIAQTQLRPALALCVGLVVAGCAQHEETPLPLKPEDRQAAEGIVASQLAYPKEVQFGDLRSYSIAQGILLCGTVPAEKSFGGYAGPVRFSQVWQFNGSGYQPQPVATERTADGKRAAGWTKQKPACG